MRRVVEDCLTLDANRLAHGGWFNGRREGAIRWTSGNSVSAEYDGQYLHLRYALSGTPHQQRLRVQSQPCHLGGQRYYIHCPHCESRRYRLPLGGQGFLCRACYDLPYYLQQAGEDDKLLYRRDRLEARLLDPDAKRGLGQLLDRLDAAEEAIDRRGMEKFGPVYADLSIAPPGCGRDSSLP